MLGSGQLGRMSGAAARQLGYRLIVLSPDEDSPAGHVADHSIVASLDDADAYGRIATMCDVLTYEFENVSAKPLHNAAAFCPVLPHPDILSVTQNRLREKDTMRALRVPTTEYAPVRVERDLLEAVDQYGKGVLKRVSGGYDGKGQVTLSPGDNLRAAYDELSQGGNLELIFEQFVPFIRELSVIVARSHTGEVITYPCAENIHRGGILHVSIAPARIPPTRAAEAQGLAAAIAEGLHLVGVMGIELFETDRDLLVNELAPRPHNSGHYTLDACITSQFEQHIRAVAGLPLGACSQLLPAVMLNLLGEHMDGVAQNMETILSDPLVRLHLYGKAEARRGRKMGHITALGATVDEAVDRLERVWPLVRVHDESLL